MLLRNSITPMKKTTTAQPTRNNKSLLIASSPTPRMRTPLEASMAWAYGNKKAKVLRYAGIISMENQHPESVASGMEISQHRGSA